MSQTFIINRSEIICEYVLSVEEDQACCVGSTITEYGHVQYTLILLVVLQAAYSWCHFTESTIFSIAWMFPVASL